jgi:Fe-S cluster assembly protein SufD
MLTLDAAAALDGPAWLQARRDAAKTRLGEAQLPTAEQELWRYSRIGQLALDAYRPVPAGGDLPGDLIASLPAERAGLVVVVNGGVAHVELAPDAAAKGVAAGRLADLDADGASFSPVDGPVDAFTDLNEAYSADPVLVRVPRGVDLSAPLVVVEVVDAADAVVFPRLVVEAGDASAVDVLHVQRSPDVAALVVGTVQLAAGRDARLGYLDVQDQGPRVWHIGNLHAQGEQQSTVVVSAAAFGASYGRLAVDCRLVGRGATANLVSLYFADGDQMLDFRTHQDHVAPDCTSDLLFKGVIDDAAHSVYSGLIRVRPGARGTNAFQTNRNIKLSEDAWAESVPNLEIENNDVRCSHASTVGPIDVDQRFYLESRGVPTPVAEQLIVSGFFDEVLDRLPVPAARAAVRARIAEKLVRS